MGKIDNMFRASHIKTYFDQLSNVKRTNVTLSDDKHVYELHVDQRDKELESVLEQSLNIYGPKINFETTESGNPYYRVEVSGLMEDLDQE